MTAVILHDLLHDRESQSGSFRLVRHIGLGQPLPVLARQADPVIRDADGYQTVGFGHGHRDRASTIPHRHRVGGVA